MTLKEFREKRDRLDETHPVPSEYPFGRKVRYHSKILITWMEELNENDSGIALDELRAFLDKVRPQFSSR